MQPVTIGSRERRDWQPGERVLLRRFRHWLVPVGEVLVSAPLALVAAVVLLAAAQVLDPGSWLVKGAWGGTVIGMWLGIPLLRWRSASLTLTDRRLILESGLLNRVSREIPLAWIQSVGFSQSLAGRVLGYGTIEIGTATARSVSFQCVAMRRLPDELFQAAAPPGRQRRD